MSWGKSLGRESSLSVIVLVASQGETMHRDEPV